MDTYSVEPDGTGSFRVRIRAARDDPGRIAGTFPTVGQARQWVEDQIRAAADASDDLDIT
jgi:hypothetical protein